MKGLSGESIPDLLNPPPPSFLRPPQANYAYTPFAPCVTTSLGTTLDAGFVMAPPPSPTPAQPHPFVTHDVNEDDWTRFLGDLQKTGKLSQIGRAHV